MYFVLAYHNVLGVICESTGTLDSAQHRRKRLFEAGANMIGVIEWSPACKRAIFHPAEEILRVGWHEVTNDEGVTIQAYWWDGKKWLVSPDGGNSINQDWISKRFLG